MFQGSKTSTAAGRGTHAMAQTMPAAETLLAYSAEQEGGLIVHRGFISAALEKACGLFGSLWEKAASDLATMEIGLLPRPGPTHRRGRGHLRGRRGLVLALFAAATSGRCAACRARRRRRAELSICCVPAGTWTP